MNPIAILFDFDGTLIDSSGDIIDSLKLAYISSGHKDKLEIPLSLLGPPVSEMIKHLTPHLDKKLCETINANFREIYDNSLYPKTFLYEGVLDFLAQCLQNKITLFVVTNKMKLATQRILSILKIEDFFKDVITPDHVSGKRMNKNEMVEYAIKMNFLQNKAAILVGDSVSDIEAAHLNGIESIGFFSGFGNAQELSGANPTYTAKSFNDIDQIVSKMINI